MTNVTSSPTNTLTFTTSLQHRITVFKHDLIGKEIQQSGLYEKDNITLLNKILKKITNPVVLDIGANIGNHALAFSTVAKAVYSFEPLPKVFSVLQTNIAQNNIDNIHAQNVALSDSHGNETIYMVTSGNVGASSFDKRSDNVEPITVSKRVGDDFLQEKNIEHIDFIKIDVEAHEAYVLHGLHRTLKRCQPVITMEWDDPLTLERINGSEALNTLFEQYNIYVLGSNYDRGFWLNQSLALIQRKITRHFKKREAALYPFDSTKLYRNLLLIPKGKEHLIDGILSHLN